MATQLQSKQLDASAVKTIKSGLLRHLKDMRSDSFFKELYNASKTMCQELEFEPPTLPRRIRAPKKITKDYHGVPNRDHGCDTPEKYYKTQFLSVIDLMTNKIEQRFDQKTLNYLISLEDLTISAANGDEFRIQENLEGDVDVPKLSSELNLLASFVKEVQSDLKDITSIQTVIDVMKQGKLTKVFSELHSVIKLYLTVPLSNATAERSFSALRRIKTYLRSTLTQEHLNHFLVLNAHRELLDRIDVNEVCQSVMKVNERRRKYFGC